MVGGGPGQGGYLMPGMIREMERYFDEVRQLMVCNAVEEKMRRRRKGIKVGSIGVSRRECGNEGMSAMPRLKESRWERC